MFTSSKDMSMLKGVGLGIAVGSAAAGVAALAGSKMMSKKTKRACRKSAAKCMKTVEGMLNNMYSITK